MLFICYKRVRYSIRSYFLEGGGALTPPTRHASNLKSWRRPRHGFCLTVWGCIEQTLWGSMSLRSIIKTFELDPDFSVHPLWPKCLGVIAMEVERDWYSEFQIRNWKQTDEIIFFKVTNDSIHHIRFCWPHLTEDHSQTPPICWCSLALYFQVNKNNNHTKTCLNKFMRALSHKG